MDSTIPIVKQDVTAALEYFKTKNFEFLGIMGNRIMSNLLICGEKDLMVIGYMIREVSDEFDFISREDAIRLNGCMDAGKQFIQNILNIISLEGEFSQISIWENYYNYKMRIVEFIPTDVDLSVYEKDPGFTGKTTSFLMEFLLENKVLLLEDYNNLLMGILNEESRVINLHGFEKRDLIFYIFIKAFLEYYRYLLAFKIVSNVEGDVIKNRIYPFVDKITHLPTELDELYKVSNVILGDLGYQTRVFYMENNDPDLILKKL
jgi:hypothetical protein